MDNPAVVGVDLGGTNVRAGLVRGNQISRVVTERIPSQGSREDVISSVVNAIEQVLNEDVAAIGIGVPGIVNTRRGVVYDVQKIPSWTEVPLGDIISRRFGLPVFINNDANCFAAGEWFFGQGKGYQNVVGLVMGTGVAAGIVANGQLYEGRNCGSGELGMLPYLKHNLEFYSSGNYFSHFHHISGEEAFRLAQAGDPGAISMFEEFGRHFSWVIRAALYTFDPDIIILGGSVSKSFSFFQESMWRHLADFPYRPVIENIIIKPSDTENIALLGGAALFFNAGWKGSPA